MTAGRWLFRLLVPMLLCLPGAAFAQEGSELPAPPPDRVLDGADLLDADRQQKIVRHLQTAAENDILIYLVTVTELPGGEMAGGHAARLRREWLPEGLGAILVYLESDRRFAVVATGDFERIRGERSTGSVVRRAEQALAQARPVTQVLREAVLDLEYEIRMARKENLEAQKKQVPAFVGTIVLVTLTALGVLLYAINQLRLHNLFDQTYPIPVQPKRQRFGGPNTGGHCAVLDPVPHETRDA